MENAVYNLVDVFAGRFHGAGNLAAHIASQMHSDERATIMRPGMKTPSLMFRNIDLGGKCWIIDSPIQLNQLDSVVISNGCIVAGPNFPDDGYVFEITGANTVKFENLLVECSKRANGFFFNRFIRVRVEDCTILHQKHFGIYGNPTGANHELEVVKCNIMEFVFGDGEPGKNNEGIVPDFKEARNRTSVGVFLGQADNVVADCNINLCRVGIRVGMRANRIQGNHITAGKTYSNALFNCIELDRGVKSSCLIVNNYLDNGRLYIKTSARSVSHRNYVTVTDNLFYRGFNHPIDDEFNHVVIEPSEPGSSLTNLIIASNQFYNQDENLDEIEERLITPIRVATNEPNSIDPGLTTGSRMSGNSFTWWGKFKVKPMGTQATRYVDLVDTALTVDFSDILPWGAISLVSLQREGGGSLAGEVDVVINGEKKVKLTSSKPLKERVMVTVSVDTRYGGLDYVVH